VIDISFELQSHEFLRTSLSGVFKGSSRTSIGFFIYILVLPFYWSNFSFLILVGFITLSRNVHIDAASHRPSSVNLALIFFIAIFGISILLSDSIIPSLQFSAAWPSSLLVYYVVFTQMDYKKDWRIFCLSFSICALFSALLCIFGFYFTNSVSSNETIAIIRSPLFVVPNDTLFLSLITPFSLSLIIGSQNTAIRLIASLSVISSLVAIIAFESRTALVVIFVCGTVYLWNGRIRTIIIYLLVLGISVLLIDAFLGFPIYQKLPTIPSSRIPLWHAAFTMFRENPLFGGGPFTFSPYYQDFLKAISYPSWIIVDKREIPWPHNLYLELLAGSGLIGLTSFLSLIVVIYYKLFYALKAQSTDNLMIKALLSVITGFVVAALVETTFLRVWVLILFFALAGFVANATSTKASK